MAASGRRPEGRRDDVMATTQLTIARANGATGDADACGHERAGCSCRDLRCRWFGKPTCPELHDRGGCAAGDANHGPGPPTALAPTPISPNSVAGSGSPDPVLIVAGLAILAVVVGLVIFIARRPRG